MTKAKPEYPAAVYRMRGRLEVREFEPHFTVHQDRATLAELNEAGIDPQEWTEAMNSFAARARGRLN